MSRDRLRELIQEVHDRHRYFHDEFKKGPRYVGNGIERTGIVNARSAFFDSFNRLFLGHLDPLRRDFEADPLRAVDDVIHFLEIDIPAFRCGYEKERYLRKLKSVSLTSAQQSRLRVIALHLVSTPHYLRELRDWGRLMIVLADKAFVSSLRTLSSSPDHFTQQNARRMLKTILDNRQDLSGANQSRNV